MGRLSLIIISAFVVLILPTASARAGTIWQWTHEASGEGWARVFDGGAAQFDSEFTGGLGDPFLSFGALDDTRPGTSGAAYGTGGRSWILTPGDELIVGVDFGTGYVSGSRIDGDLPGGEGAGTLSSVIEFVMPVDELQWRISADVRRSAGFIGSSRFLVENVTRSETLLDLRLPEVFETTLSGRAGDLIRVSSEISGSGSFPEGVAGLGSYNGFMQLSFTIPEPGVIWLVGAGAVVLSGRKRPQRVKAP